MDGPGSVLLIHSSIDEISQQLPFGHGGISISKDWVLTHIAVLDKITYNMKSRFIRDLTPGKLTMVPREVKQNLRFYVYYDLGQDVSFQPSNRTKVNVKKCLGTVVAAWSCPLLKDTFSTFFKTWKFSESSKLDRLIEPVFLLLHIDSDEKSISTVEVSAVEQVLSRLLDHALRNPTRGSNVEIVSAPFGNPMFIGTVARGIISNVVGTEGCVILTDAFAFPLSEGSPVYDVSPNRKHRTIIGMVIAIKSWCRGEIVDYIFVANLAPCLLSILQKEDLRLFPINNQHELDKSVVLVRCGINYGTGILVDKDSGTFLTCSHVVNEAPRKEISIEAKVENLSERVQAKLIYKTTTNKPYDVAVMRVNPKNLDPSLRSLRLCSDPIMRGEPVVIVGFPFFSNIRPSISNGVVAKSMDCMLITTCCTYNGCSGGPVISCATGEMLGMVACNAQTVLSFDKHIQPRLYPRMSMSVPVTVLREPLQQYLRTDNTNVLRAFTCNDAMVKNIWDLYPQFISSHM